MSSFDNAELFFEDLEKFLKPSLECYQNLFIELYKEIGK